MSKVVTRSISPTSALPMVPESLRLTWCQARWLVAASLLAAGCGRIAYDPTPATDGMSGEESDAEACTADTCNSPPSTCHEQVGQCTEGACSYSLLAEGASCDDSDVLTENDLCSATGLCAGTPSGAWPMVFDNSFGDVAVPGIGIDASGGLYSAVRFEGSWNGSGFDANLSATGISYTNLSWADTALMKLTAGSAAPVWDYNFAGTSGRVEAFCFEVLADGTTFVAGHLRSKADFGSFGLQDVGSTQNPLIFSHDNAGTISAMQFYDPGSQNAQIHGITIESGFVAIAGVYGSNVDFGAGGIGTSNGDDGYLAVFDSALNLQWARPMSGTGTIYGRGTHVTSTGISWVAGDFGDTVDYGTGVQTTSGGRDTWFASYDALGAIRWSHTWGSSANETDPQLIGDAAGNTYVVGRFSDAFSIAGSAMLATTGGQDIYVAAFDDSGARRWIQTFGSTNADSLNNIGFLADGSLWIAGGFDGTLIAGTHSAASAGATDGYVVVLNTTDGTPTGLSAMASASDLSLRSVAVDEQRSVVWVGGAINGSVELGTATVAAGKAYIYPFAFAP